MGRSWTRMARAAVALLALVSPAALAQTLEVATDQSPVGLDPHIATAFSTALINRDNIYEGLTAIDADLRVIPALAESWTISEDGLVYTFTLREGVTFHNGEPFDSEDVKFSIERVLDEATGSPIASRFNLIEEVEATSPTEVVIRLSAPFAPFLSQIAQLYIVPKDYVEAGNDLQRAAMGTGPFSFAEWAPDTFIRLEANPDYWEEGVPALDEIKFNIVPEASTRQIGLSTGAYHLLPNVDPATAMMLSSDPRITTSQTLDLAYSLIGLNVTQPPFDDPKVREALNYALDRDAIIQAAYFGMGEPAGPLSPALVDWALPAADFPCYSHDPEQAKALLTEAGLQLPVPLTLNVLGSIQILVDAAQVIQAVLNEGGFDVTLNVQDQGQFIQDWSNSNFQAFLSLNGGSVDPDGYFYRTFLTDGSTNVFGYSDPEVDAMLNEARTVSDPAVRRGLYNQVQTALACHGPIAHLVYGQLTAAAGPGVEGFELIANRSLRSLRTTRLSR